MSTELLVDAALRWVHVLSGILWMGSAYFLGLVVSPVQARLEAAAGRELLRELMPRAMWWLRWSATATLVSGLALFFQSYLRGSNLYTEDGVTDRGRFIMWGMTLAVLMWANVVFVIGPAQKRIVAAVRDEEAVPAEQVRRAVLAATVNAYLAPTMLFLMIAAAHLMVGFSYGLLTAAAILGAVVVRLLLGLGSRV